MVGRVEGLDVNRGVFREGRFVACSLPDPACIGRSVKGAKHCTCPRWTADQVALAIDWDITAADDEDFYRSYRAALIESGEPATTADGMAYRASSVGDE